MVGLFQGSVTPRTSEKNPHHLIGTVFCRSRSQHINNSIYIYIHILYQGDLKNQLENKRRRRCSWFILQIWMISENSGFFAPNHPFLDMVFSNRNQSNLGCFPYFGISTQIWMRKLLSRWRRIPPLRRCCAPWSNRRRWSKLNETGGVVGSIKQLGTAKLGGGVILERWICCFSWKLGGISLVWSPRFLVWPFFCCVFCFGVLKDGILMEVFKPEHLEASKKKNEGLLLCFRIPWNLFIVHAVDGRNPANQSVGSLVYPIIF